MQWINKYKLVFVIILSLSSCKKLVDIGAPIDNITNENVYDENGTAISVLTGIYANLVSAFTGNTTVNISSRTGLSSDELTLFSGVTNAPLIAFYKNALAANNSISIGGEIWTRFYSLIFTCNAAIEGVSASSQLSTSVKNQLIGEALFVRSFAYFYLINLYGDAPLALVSDPKITGTLPRVKADDVYKQIITDLKQAELLLSDKYLNGQLNAYPEGEFERLRPTRWAATGLLSRVYLFYKDFENSELSASKIIEQKNLYDTVSLNQVFLKNNKEAIWQLQPIRSGRNSEDAFLFQLPFGGPNAFGNPFYLSNSLIEAFESDDQRVILGNWVDRKTIGTENYYYSNKYKATTGSVSEYPVVMRLGEQYLIRAEARAYLGKIIGANSAAEDLNIIRRRAGLEPVLFSNQEDIVNSIFRERRVELFSEWGHRWLDIKRSGKIDSIMTASATIKGTVWESYQQWYPLPFRDIQYSVYLKQNGGYN